MRNYNRFKNRYRSALYIISIIFLIFSCKDDSLFVNNSTDIIAFNVSVERLNNTKGLPINSSADTSFTNFGLFIYQTPLNASFSDPSDP